VSDIIAQKNLAALLSQTPLSFIVVYGVHYIAKKAFCQPFKHKKTQAGKIFF
jgi:hypothetical protein